MRGWMTAGIAAIGLAGCAQLGLEPVDPNVLQYQNIEDGAFRAYEASFSETPFARGALSIVATEANDYSLATYALFPCGEATVCGGGPMGPRGRVELTPDYTVVRGLYGREFWLSPGGDGAIRYGTGQAVPLAWNAMGR